MPEINQYTLSHKELLEMLVKHLGIHEGKWALVTQFNMSAGNFGPTEDEIIPGMIVAVAKLGIQRAETNSPSALVVDAEVVNPASKSEKSK